MDSPRFDTARCTRDNRPLPATLAVQGEERQRVKNRRNAWLALHRDETGQGLVEYVLILALVAFAATAGMQSLASALNITFDRVGDVIGLYIT